MTNSTASLKRRLAEDSFGFRVSGFGFELETANTKQQIASPEYSSQRRYWSEE